MKKPTPPKDYRKEQAILPSRKAVRELAGDNPSARSITNYAKLTPADASGKAQVKLAKMFGGK